jgi:hypothetical protein
MIVGFNVDAIDAEKGEGSQGNIQINYNPEIEDVTETEVGAFEEPVARIDYSFTVEYEAGGEQAAHIKMSGNVLWKGNAEEVVEEWDENGVLLEEIEAPLMNEMYRRLISEAVGVANTLSLLPPVPTPQID